MLSKPGLGTRLAPEQSAAGGVVSTTVTVWLHDALLPQLSVACQVFVISLGQVPLVMVLTTVTVNPGSQQVETATGVPNCQAEPHSTVLLGLQVKVMLVTAGGVTMKST